MRPAKSSFYEFAAFAQPHFPFQTADTANALCSAVFHACDFQRHGAAQPHLLRRKLRHSHDIKIRVHRIIRQIRTDHTNHPSSNQIIIRNPLNPLKNQRMMRQQQIRMLRNRFLNCRICRIQRNVYFLNLFRPASSQQSDVIPAARVRFVCLLIKKLYQF